MKSFKGEPIAIFLDEKNSRSNDILTKMLLNEEISFISKVDNNTDNLISESMNIFTKED